MSVKEIRELAEADLITFITLISPETVLGSVHLELCQWLMSPETKSHKLVLLPRDHQKSRILAFYIMWRITKEPVMRVLLLSSTSNLAEKQLKFIKDKLDSKVYRRYWPQHINEDLSKRERWTAGEISLDHPIRKEEGIRDPTVFTAGLTTSITGMHADLTCFDDVVVYDNAYTEEGRDRVNSRVSLIASIEGAESEQLVVGTRYHPKDAYGLMQDMKYTRYDDEGVEIGEETVYSVMVKVVEEDGEFLWPRQQRQSDGKWFGFDINILNRKKAQYLDRTQFYAQYYNNPNNPEGSGIPRTRFQYYDREHLNRSGPLWYLKDKRLNLAAAMDLAYTTGKKSDFTSIVVAGMDADGFIYTLDIDRFKTDRISVYYERLLAAYAKWGFRKVRIEVTAGQKVIVEDLKRNYIAKNGLMLSIDELTPTRHQGTKQERIRAILEPRYDNLQIYHYRGGNCQVLEDELILENPPHDDVKESLANAIDVLKPPARLHAPGFAQLKTGTFNSRFGGIS
jgi:phage terminase large subunit-like protein